MPMPWTYRHASREWAAILADFRDYSGLSSDNMAYTALQGTLYAFRRRLTVAQAISFAAVLPAIPRAIFVDAWDSSAAPLPPAPPADLLAEVRALRPHHNISPDTSIAATAYALRRAIDARDFARALAPLGDWAQQFWAVPDVDAADLEQVIR